MLVLAGRVGAGAHALHLHLGVPGPSSPSPGPRDHAPARHQQRRTAATRPQPRVQPRSMGARRTVAPARDPPGVIEGEVSAAGSAAAAAATHARCRPCGVEGRRSAPARRQRCGRRQRTPVGLTADGSGAEQHVADASSRSVVPGAGRPGSAVSRRTTSSGRRPRTVGTPALRSHAAPGARRTGRSRIAIGGTGPTNVRCTYSSMGGALLRPSSGTRKKKLSSAWVGVAARRRDVEVHIDPEWAIVRRRWRPPDPMRSSTW